MPLFPPRGTEKRKEFLGFDSVFISHLKTEAKRRRKQPGLHPPALHTFPARSAPEPWVTAPEGLARQLLRHSLQLLRSNPSPHPRRTPPPPLPVGGGWEEDGAHLPWRLGAQAVPLAPGFAPHSPPLCTPFLSVTQDLSCCHIQSQSHPFPP